MYDMHYLVISHENSCVYATTDRVVTANALATGGIDCWIRGVTQYALNDFEKFKRPGEFYDNVWKHDLRSRQLSLVDSAQVSKSWLDNRDIIKRRNILFNIWETYTGNALLRVETTKWTAFSAVAETELKQCDPTQAIYTPMIEEYARISERPVKQVFDELKLKIETENITKFRITALADKFKDLINQVVTDEDSESLKTKMYIEFWGNAET